MKLSDPRFNAMPSRNRPSFFGVLHKVAVTVAMDSGHMNSSLFTMAFHWEWRLFCGSVGEVFGFIGMVTSWFQQAMKDSTGTGPSIPGMRCGESPTFQ